MSLFGRRRISSSAAETQAATDGANASFHQLELIADSAPDLLAYIDSSGSVRFVNRAYERWFGRDRADIAGKHLRELLGDEVWRATEPHLSAALGGAAVRHDVHLSPQALAEERWIDCVYTPDVDATGRVRGVVAHVSDVTARRNLASELHHDDADDHAIAAALRASESRYRELAEQLQAADQRKNEFLALLAHELRNPLAPIRNGLQLVRMASDAVARERACAMMDRQLRHMVRLVDDLLDVSRITRSKLELRREPVELATVVRNAVESSGELIDSFEHELLVELPDDPVVLDADPVRMTQVVSNLLNNAAKYTNPAGRLEVRAWREGHFAIISVRDTGIGIARENLQRVFDLFSQLQTDPSRASGGLGVGLSLVRELVTMHGGTVEARSDGPGRGSEFIVRLPVREASAVDSWGTVSLATLVAEAGRHRHLGRPRRVLVVDDNADNAESLSELLRALRHETQIVFDGPSAVDAVASFAPEVVLLDIGLPGYDGYEVARRIRESAGGRNIRLIAITGWGQEDDKRRAWAAGFDAHLTKPVDPAALLLIVASG
jgi:PAS domain S-box-containing protein